MYTVRILKAASRELEGLDKAIARRIVDRIRWLAENKVIIYSIGHRREVYQKR